MNQETFENLMKLWRRAQDEKAGTPASPRTASCLSFDDLQSYARGKFDAAQQSHVVTCAHCQTVIRLFQKHLPQIETIKKPEPETSFVQSIKRRAADIRQLLPWRIFDEGRRGTPFIRPALIGIPFILAIITVIVLFRSRERNYADLARIEHLPYISLQMKAGSSLDEAERLFEEGMVFYVEKNYLQAIQKLTQTVRQDSSNASYHFYLGLCYLLSDSVDRAIEHLQKTISLGESSVLEKAYWYLGNAWLLKGERDQALAAFRKVVEMEGDYQWEAEEIIGEIEALSRE